MPLITRRARSGYQTAALSNGPLQKLTTKGKKKNGRCHQVTCPSGDRLWPDQGHKRHNMKDGNNSEEGLQILYDSPRNQRAGISCRHWGGKPDPIFGYHHFLPAHNRLCTHIHFGYHSTPVLFMCAYCTKPFGWLDGTPLSYIFHILEILLQ